MVKGYSIENAIAEFLEPFKPQARPAAPPEPIDTAPEAQALRSHTQLLTEQVRTLRAYVSDLRADLAEKEEALRRANSKLDRLRDKTAREIKRDQEIKIRDKEIERLRSLLRSERKYIKKLKRFQARQKNAEQIEELKGLRRLKPLEAFSKDAVVRAEDRWGLEEGDLVLLENASGGGRNAADLLIARGIEAVITDGDMAPATKEYIQESGIPVFSSQELPIQRIDGLPFVRPNDLEAAQARWTEEMKARQAERQAERLESIIQEYRVERKKEEKRLQK
ncbi:Uncharacterised protein [uncultured archaeon]|nr:Uncharacterised protein [uncultured archaeon]